VTESDAEQGSKQPLP